MLHRTGFELWRFVGASLASGLLIGSVALAVAPTAQSQTRSPAILEGQLLAGNGAPVANAMVQWSIVGAGPGQTGTSDAGGNFAFDIPVAGTTQVQLSVIANLYSPKQTNVQLQPGATTKVTIRLARKPAGQYGAVSGVVHNTSGVAIPNAAVSILGAGDLLSTTTDSTGKYQLKTVGFNANLILQASTTGTPCIVGTQAPFALNSTHATVNVQAPGVLSITANCPAPQPQIGGLNAGAVNPMDIDDTVQWQQADSLSIQQTGAPNAWNAGHVNDIIRLPPGQGVLVGSDEGGVWTIGEDPGRTAEPLSNKWSSITVSSLALGAGGANDVYAGTFAYGDSEGGDLWETDTSQSPPLNNWLQVNPKPPCGSIYRILTVVEAGRIVLACDTGLWWSQIPPAPSVKGTYSWAQALPAAIGSKAFSGLAKGTGWATGGPTGTIIASRFGGAAPSQIIYTAMWSGSKLVLTSSTVAGPATKLSRTSVATCSSNPQLAYAVASDTSGQGLSGVYQSANGGVNWNLVSLPPSPGFDGDANQAIAVSPDCGTVAVGWQAGTFVSFTGGGSWNLLTDVGEYNNLHLGIHALTFDPIVPATLFIGSDGGVASAMGLMNGSNPVFESDWNRELFNLEYFDGTGSASANGLVAGATQDNGVLYAAFPGPWQHVIDCPGIGQVCWGETALFATPKSIGPTNDLLIDQNILAPISSTANGVESLNGNIPFNGGTAIPLSPPCTPNPCPTYGVHVEAAVRFPGGFVNTSGQQMIAVAEIYAYDAGDGVYGLFANDDGSSAHWELLNGGPALWAGVTAIAPTYDGSSIFVGNSIGQIFRLDAPFTSPAVQLTVNAPSPCLLCYVAGIYAFNKDMAFATLGPHFLGWYGLTWDTYGEGSLAHDREFLSIVATDLNRIYIASSAGVFDTSNMGITWSVASTGLPTLIPGERGFGFAPPNFLASHDYLQLVTEPAGDTRLYLASYGRSMWRTNRPLPPPPPKRSFTTVQIEIQTGNDNAEKYSEIQANLGGVFLCLKPSNTTQPSPGGVCANGPTATDQDGNQEWPNGVDVFQTFALSPGMVLDGAALQIKLIQHYSSPNTADNWDIQSVAVSGSDINGSLLEASMSNGAVAGDNCMARLKEGPTNPDSVTYGLDSNDPLGFNQTHPVTYFGATPPGSCPQ